MSPRSIIVYTNIPYVTKAILQDSRNNKVITIDFNRVLSCVYRLKYKQACAQVTPKSAEEMIKAMNNGPIRSCAS